MLDMFRDMQNRLLDEVSSHTYRYLYDSFDISARVASTCTTWPEISESMIRQRCTT